MRQFWISMILMLLIAGCFIFLDPNHYQQFKSDLSEIHFNVDNSIWGDILLHLGFLAIIILAIIFRNTSFWLLESIASGIRLLKPVWKPVLLFVIAWIVYVVLIVNRRHPFQKLTISKDSLCHQLEAVTPSDVGYHAYRKWDFPSIIANACNTDRIQKDKYYSSYGIESVSPGVSCRWICTYYYDSTYEALRAADPCYQEVSYYNEEYKRNGNQYRICFVIFNEPPSLSTIQNFRRPHQFTQIDSVRFYYREYLNFSLEHR